jgi:serine/threonine protein kinase/Tfp pilus assembly protein PilF
MPLALGTRLGRYEILAPIGAGGMAEVYRAQDPRLNREVAIKVSAAQFSERFEREAKAIAALNHPNICQVYDVGPNYLVMELIEGTPLAGPLPLDVALRHAVQIADALSAAHAKGITHRDLKPANILVTASGIKLLDFGLALLSQQTPSDPTKTIGMTMAGTILGTVAYMSPEQAETKHVDARSDVFSFGSVLYEMLSGKRAFTGDSAVAVMAAVLHKEPKPLELAPALQSILARCLRKSPAERFQSMVQVKDALLNAISGVSSPGAAIAGVGPLPPSIAVLPFANLSADKENEYFSDGLAEEILNLLTKIPGLKVIARTSSFAFRGKEQDITKIAEALRVGTILEGSVRRAGNRLRVTTQLINAVDGTHLWSERYDRDMTDVFAIQDEIAQAISEALKLRLAPRARTANIEAYQYYLKGQYYRLPFTAESLAKAKECFEQALAIDPTYASAYSGLAGYYYALAALSMKPASDVAPLAKSAAEKALALDPANSEAHSVLAAIAAAFEYNWESGETHFRQAMTAQPVPPIVRHRYVMYYLLPLGRVAEAMKQSRLALETDPLSVVLHNGMAWSMYNAKQYRETIEYARRALEIDPNFYFIWFAMGQAQLHAGLKQEAIASLKRGVELAPWWHAGVAYLATAYCQAGDGERSQEWVRKLISHGPSDGAAVYYAAAGEVDAMFEALDGVFRQHSVNLPWTLNDRFFDAYHADPRWQALRKRMNLATTLANTPSVPSDAIRSA